MTPISRRAFLERGATLVAAGMAVPSFIAETARIIDNGGQLATPARAAGRKVLVIIQLAGGNDGLNTVIPFGDQQYYTVRPNIAIPRAQVLGLNEYVGLHPALTNLRARYNQGQVAIVQGVSYPNPNRSHFRGTDIWESAVPDRLEAKGWVGRYLEACGCQRADHLEAMTVGSTQSAGTFWTEMALVPAVASLSSFRYTSVNSGSTTQRNAEIATLRAALAQADGHPEGEFLRQSILTALTDADILQAAATRYTPVGAYPTNGFGNSMKLVAQLVAADVGTQVFYVSLGGFDTHSNQLTAHQSLMTTLDTSINAFLRDMEAVGKLGDVTLMTFSEFGRRLAQNGSAGTDHGVAAPMFVIGGGVRGGLHGEYPSLTTGLSGGDLGMKVDFRQVYATVLADWLHVAPQPILGGDFRQLDLFGPSVSCAPRPKVNLAAEPTGDGRLLVTVSTGGGMIRELRFGPAANAQVSIGEEARRPGGFTYRMTPPAPGVRFQVHRASAGGATVPLTVVDDCGEWPTLVGGGQGAF